MFVDALARVDRFTKPIHFITRYYGGTDIIPETATLFFVNEDGFAVTCRHVVDQLLASDPFYARYLQFRSELRQFQKDPSYQLQRQRLEEKYGFTKDTVIRVRSNFMHCVAGEHQLTIHRHPTYDLAIIRFNGYEAKHYNGHALFLKEEGRIRPGRSLCRLGYPFPEFTNYRLNPELDDIEWTDSGRMHTPGFPIDGIITRQIADKDGVFGIEMSTPGLRGQSGGPLFDTDGLIYGMQSATMHLHLGFDQINREVISDGVRKRVSNYPFLNVGRCIHVRVIKDFLRSKGVTFYEV